MHPASVRLLASTAAAFLLGAASIHAGTIPWSFDTTKSSHSVVGDLSNLGNVGLAAVNSSSSDDKTVPILTVFASTSPSGEHNDTYSGSSYNVIVDLIDSTSGDPGEFSFTGHLSGFVNPNVASLSSTFDDLLTVHHTLGGHDYAVTIGPFVSPQSPTVNGEIDMTVTIDGEVITPPPPTNNAPEPTSVVLGALGLGAACLFRLRRLATA